MPARVLFIGLDAAECTLLERWASEGYCPNLAALIVQAASIPLSNSLETLPGAIWPEIATGVGCGRQAKYYHGAQLRTGEAERRPLQADEEDKEQYFWVRADRAGLRTFVGDVPQTAVTQDFTGLQLFEFGCHDRNFAICSEPPALLEDIRRVYGDHPVHACDRHGETTAGYEELLAGLKKGAAIKAQFYAEYLEKDSWDLFTACFSESHCVGHQFWHFMDANHPKHDPRAPTHLKTAIRDVYIALDEAIGKLVRAAGPDAQVVLLASHGMDLYFGGPNLLNEVLARLGLTSAGQDTAKGRMIRDFQFSSDPVVRTIREALKALAGKRVIQSVQGGSGSLHEPFTRSATQAADVRNNRCGAIRLNLKGREPFGEIASGNEEIALTEFIREALLELKTPGTDQPIVREVRTAREAFGPDHHPDVPDIMVVFHDDLGVLDECWSPRIGHVKRSVYQHWLPRTGDHTTRSRAWVKAQPFVPGAALHGGDVLDVAPTILDLLGLPYPDGIDGRSLTQLITGSSQEPRDRRAGPRALGGPVGMADLSDLPRKNTTHCA